MMKRRLIKLLIIFFVMMGTNGFSENLSDVKLEFKRLEIKSQLPKWMNKDDVSFYLASHARGEEIDIYL